MASTPTAPFIDKNPLLPAEGVRNTPGIAEALRMARENIKRVDVDIAQLVLDGLPTLPMDLRKWPGVTGDLLTEIGLQTLPPASLDVLVSQFALYKNGHDQAAHLAEILRPGGVWYFMELLPLDCPGHWLYHALPPAWEHLKRDQWTLYALYNRLQEMGLTVTLKRHAFSQPVSVIAARAALEPRPGILRGLASSAFTAAFSRLKENHIPSEFTIIEGWAQKRQEQP